MHDAGEQGAGEPAQRRVGGPAIGLIVTGAIGLLVVAPLEVLGLVTDGGRQLEKLQSELGSGFSVGIYHAIRISLLLLNLVGSAFLILAGMRMRQLKSWVLCVVACFAAIVPCWACCCVGIPIGIWGLVVLMRDEVKQAFTS